MWISRCCSPKATLWGKLQRLKQMKNKLKKRAVTDAALFFAIYKGYILLQIVEFCVLFIETEEPEKARGTKR